jgi:hypothetical protein
MLKTVLGLACSGLFIALAPLLADAIVARAQTPATTAAVVWQPPVSYTTSPPPFTQATLPGTIAIGSNGVTFTLPAASVFASGPFAPCLAYFETDSLGGMRIAAPSGSWAGITGMGGVLDFPYSGVSASACVWSDGKYWHLSASQG